jgi:predicted nucleic acid-binding protein
VSIVVLDASAGAEIVAQTGTGKRLLALTPRNRIWWAPDHFHVEATGALRRMLMKDLITEDRAEVALRRLLRLPIHIAAGRPLIAEAWTMRHNYIIQDGVYVVLAKHLNAPLLTGDRKLAGAPKLPIQVLHLSPAT